MCSHYSEASEAWNPLCQPALVWWWVACGLCVTHDSFCSSTKGKYVGDTCLRSEFDPTPIYCTQDARLYVRLPHPQMQSQGSAHLWLLTVEMLG